MKAIGVLAQGVFLAIAVFAVFSPAQAQQRGSAPISATETLRGHKAMSVEVVTDWRGDARSRIPEERLKSLIEQELRGSGIELLPAGSYPMLRLQMLNSCCWEGDGTLMLYDNWVMNLFFVQAVTLPGGALAEGMTWRRTSWNFTPGWITTQNSMQSGLRDMVRIFMEQHRSVNR